MYLPFDTPVAFDTAVNAFEFVFESVLHRHWLLRELHPRGVGGQRVDGAVPGGRGGGRDGQHAQRQERPRHYLQKKNVN